LRWRAQRRISHRRGRGAQAHARRAIAALEQQLEKTFSVFSMRV